MCSHEGCYYDRQTTAYEKRIRDGSSDVCSSDLVQAQEPAAAVPAARRHAGAGPRAADAVRGARQLPADPRFAGGSRRRRAAPRVRGAEGEAAGRGPVRRRAQTPPARLGAPAGRADLALGRGGARRAQRVGAALPARSEEHTSELQSLMRTSYAVFCLNKKKTT